MKKIGLVGGISWTSTIDYYRIINEQTNKQLGGLNFAECILYSVNFDNFRTANAKHDWDASFHLLADAALQLKKAGAECIVLCANTAHIVAERVQERVALPLLDIRQVVADAVQERNIKKVGLLGTVYTMELDFYKDKLLANGIVPVIPKNPADRNFIEHTLLHELGKGLISGATKKEYIKIIDQLIGEGAEGIILGCTEIPLLIAQEDISVPVFNSTELHAQAAVAFALSETANTTYENK
jgi:aspartate racemase